MVNGKLALFLRSAACRPAAFDGEGKGCAVSDALRLDLDQIGIFTADRGQALTLTIAAIADDQGGWRGFDDEAVAIDVAMLDLCQTRRITQAKLADGGRGSGAGRGAQFPYAALQRVQDSKRLAAGKRRRCAACAGQYKANGQKVSQFRIHSF